ncbi:MAG: hypothetical protein WC792_01065 [Candidatus Micrarchaeia archaeon]|jgi:hypothetical protein
MAVDSLYWVHAINAGLGAGILLAASIVYTYFRGTTLEGALRWLAAGIVFFILHAFALAYEMRFDAPFAESMLVHDAIQLAFILCTLVGLYLFKQGFEKFNWGTIAKK